MSRKKNVKSATRRNASKQSTNIAAQIEQEYLQLPQQLAGHFNQAADALKLKAAKTKAALQKTEAQIEKLNKTIQAGKTKKTTTARKQATAAKKSQTVAKKQASTLTKELTLIEKSIAALVIKQAKMQALRKHLAKFEKEWAKTAKTMKKKPAKTKATKAVKAKTTAKPRKNPKISDATTTPHAIRHDQHDPLSTTDEMHFSDASESNA